jgi:hypothetical protein
MKDKAVITLLSEEIFEIKRGILDNDREEAIHILKRLDKKIDDAMELK